MSGLTHVTKSEGLIQYATMKKVPMPTAAVYLSGLAMFLGGVGILTQRFLPISYGMLIACLVIFAFSIHDFWNEQDATMKMNSMIGFQKNLAIAAAMCMLLSMVV